MTIAYGKLAFPYQLDELVLRRAKLFVCSRGALPCVTVVSSPLSLSRRLSVSLRSTGAGAFALSRESDIPSIS